MKKIIIDTDPGIDDAMAILFALLLDGVELLGLTTVFGNVHTPLATRNALALLEFAQRSDIPVAEGAHAPLALPLLRVASAFHHTNGLGGVSLPEPTTPPDPRSAAQFIVETVMAQPGEVTLVPIGPLTNIALALQLEPRLTQHVANVVLMGGAALVPGNVNPAAEANIWNDPHAADKLFASGAPVTMVGLDVTAQVIMDTAYFEQLKGYGRFGQFIYDISRFYQAAAAETGPSDDVSTHDPSAIAFVHEASLFGVTRGQICVEQVGVGLGKTYLSPQGGHVYDGPWGKRPLVDVCTSVDAPRLLKLYMETIRNAIS